MNLAVLDALAAAGVAVGLVLLWVGLAVADPARVAGRPWWPGRSGAAGQVAGGRLWWRVGVAVAAGVLVGLVTGWPVGAVLAALAVWGLPGLLGPDRHAKTQLARIEAVAAWAEQLRDTLSAAAGVEQAILATAPVAPTPIQGEVADLAADVTAGAPLGAALRGFAGELADPTADLVVAALVLAAEHQARHLADLLGSLAEAAREHARMRLRVAASRARTRTSVRMVVATTLGLAVGLVVFNRRYLHPYDTPTGQLVLLAVGGLFTGGFGWLSRASRFREPTRFLRLDQPHPPENGTVGEVGW